jgi:hypothetical protein
VTARTRSTRRTAMEAVPHCPAGARPRGRIHLGELRNVPGRAEVPRRDRAAGHHPGGDGVVKKGRQDSRTASDFKCTRPARRSETAPRSGSRSERPGRSGGAQRSRRRLWKDDPWVPRCRLRHAAISMPPTSSPGRLRKPAPRSDDERRREDTAARRHFVPDLSFQLVDVAR